MVRESHKGIETDPKDTAIARVVEMVYDVVLEILQVRYMHCLHLGDQKKSNYQCVGWLALAVTSKNDPPPVMGLFGLYRDSFRGTLRAFLR